MLDRRPEVPHRHIVRGRSFGSTTCFTSPARFRSRERPARVRAVLGAAALEEREHDARQREELEACYREHLPRGLAPAPADLDSDGHMLLMTTEGPLDVLRCVTGGRRFEDLVEHSPWLSLQADVRVRVADLETLIAIKEETGREKDLAQLPVLRRTLEERRRS